MWEWKREGVGDTDGERPTQRKKYIEIEREEKEREMMESGD